MKYDRKRADPLRRARVRYASKSTWYEEIPLFYKGKFTINGRKSIAAPLAIVPAASGQGEDARWGAALLCKKEEDMSKKEGKKPKGPKKPGKISLLLVVLYF